MFLLYLLFSYSESTELFDFCVIGDSTLQMFTVPAWQVYCSQNKHDPCGFSIVQQGIYYQQTYQEKLYDRRTSIGKSTDGACTFMLADYHSFEWLTTLQNYWNVSLGRTIRCRRLLTNYHHHADRFLASTRTAQSIKAFAQDMQTRINTTVPFTDFVYILPTFPMSASSAFPQTRASVLETSAVLSSMVESIASLQSLSEIWRERGRFHDNLHLDADATKEVFTVQVVASILARELQLCRQRQVKQ